jgi:hypothetical protein
MDNSISQEVLDRWAETCIRMNHLGTLVQRELESGSKERAQDLTERARMRAWKLFNELIEYGARKPEGYQEPGE